VKVTKWGRITARFTALSNRKPPFLTLKEEQGKLGAVDLLGRKVVVEA
jgi:hypothetical protein